jgi:Domain of unknown function (DUF4279)
MSESDEVPWEGQCNDAAYEFGLRCAELAAGNPYSLTGPLNGIISGLMTELWDRNFSQSEIRTAFETAIRHMPRYAAGEERRSSVSTELATADWRAPNQSHASEPDTYSKAALRLVGDDLVPNEITGLLKCEPTTARLKGQVLVLKNGREHTARTGSWILDASERKPDDLTGQIIEIMNKVNPDPDLWASLTGRFRVDMFCGLFMSKNYQGFTLSAQALLVLGARGIEFDLCLYGPPQPAATPAG